MRARFRKPCGCAVLIKAIDAYIAKADGDIETALRKAGFVFPKKTVRDIAVLEEELLPILESDNRYLLNTVNDFPRLRDFMNEAWPEWQDNTETVEKLTRTFEGTFDSVIPDYTAEYLKRVEADAELSRIGMTKQTREWTRAWSGELARLMKLSDNRMLRQILDEGLRDGLSVQEVSEKIAAGGIRGYGYRARRVATTEMLRAHSVAQQESFNQSPAVESKMWRHSGWRQYARINHMDIDGQTVKKDESFTLTGADGGVYYPLYPRDQSLPAGESINCGCIAVPIVNEEILGMSLEERNKLRDEAISELNADFDRKLDQQNSRLSLGLRDAEQWRDERVRNIEENLKNDIIKINNKELPNGLPLQAAPNAIYDKIGDAGNVLQRRLYGADGKATVDFDTTDHNRPDLHPTGAHKHEFDYSKKNPRSAWKPLSDDELEKNKDIIVPGLNYHDES